MTPHKGKRSQFLWIPWSLLGVLAVVVIGIWRSSHAPEPVSKPEDAPSVPADVVHSTPQLPRDPVPGWSADIHTRVQAIRNDGNSASRRARLADLKSRLLALPKAQASSAIQELLNSGTDTPTGDSFRVGPGGLLTGAPTLRTMLLDLLGQIDSSAAADYAKRILSEQGSPDEWAISLRNYANGSQEAGARDYLRAKVSELLHQEQWRQDPSVGYLEAFDVAVYAGGSAILSDLAGILKDKGNPATAHAAFLALDRLTQKDPATTLEALLTLPALSEGRESTRANYFARANVADPVQRDLVERYLLSPGRTAAEIQAFVGVFPNANYMISQNLLTRSPSVSGADLARSDRQALETVKTWIQDPRFEPLRAYLEKSKARLDQFVPGAAR